MNARSDATAIAPADRPRRRAAIPHGVAHALRAFVLAVACGFAHAQDPLGDVVAADAKNLLRHPDAEVRGEAALVAATLGGSALHEELFQLAKDPQPAARQRALIAIGLTDAPTAAAFLANVLADTSTRAADDGTAAAFGLGLLPADQAAPAIARVLGLVAQSSWKRQRDTVLALLLAMAQKGPRSEILALRQAFDDDSNRDPEVRALLLQLLLGRDATLDDKTVKKLLTRGSEAERAAILTWLAGTPKANDADWLAIAERCATEGSSADVRSKALLVLARARHLPGLDVALRALREASAAECGQALRTLLAIGGAGVLRAAAPRIAEERDPARKAAMLANFDAPLTAELGEHCARLVDDGSQPLALRAAAALALAHGDKARAAPRLCALFAANLDATTLQALAAAIRDTHDGPVALTALFDNPADLRLAGKQWTALLLADHPEASRQLLAALHPDARTNPLVALRAWRTANVLKVPKARPDAVPALLGKLLANP